VRRKSAITASSRLSSTARSTPGRATAVTPNIPTCVNARLLAPTCTASFSSRTSALSSRDEASPPSTAAATWSAGLSGSFSPGTAQLRVTSVAATLSVIVSDTGAASVGTLAAGATLSGPRLIAPKYLVVSALAVARSTSPASTSTALLGA
jgi:hypothetical protein